LTIRSEKKTLAVATVALTPDLDPHVTLERMETAVIEAKRACPDLRLVHFGETILGWFYRRDETREYHEKIAETIPGPATNRVAAWATAHNLYISFGLTERDGGHLFNAQVLIGPTGEILAKHRKFWIRNKAFRPGERTLTTARVDGAKVALLICADARSIKLMRAIRRERVDLVLGSLADYGTSRLLNRVMGVWYDAWTVIANRYGQENSITWHGLITIVDPCLRLHGCSMNRPNTLIHRIPITSPSPAARWFRRARTGVIACGLITSLVGRRVWKSVTKRT
jgi:predicted amidohydrolase